MTQSRELSMQEMSTECVELLPSREALSLFSNAETFGLNLNEILASNTVTAFNLFSDDATAVATVDQDFEIDQENDLSSYIRD